MNKLTWNDISNSFSSWNELKTSNLTWNDLNKDCIELLQKINDDQIQVPDKFIIRLEELFEQSVNLYNKISDTPYIKEANKSLKDRIIQLLNILALIGTILGGLSAANNIIESFTNEKESIEFHIHEINIQINTEATINNNANTKK